MIETSPTPNAVQQLYKQRKLQSTKPFNARGKKVKRCEFCQMAKNNCICTYRIQSNSKAAFLLLMHDAEVLKPSNTARLIADVVPQTFAFQWSRTNPNDNMLELIKDDKYQPFVVFPKQYAHDSQLVYENTLNGANIVDKIPLFILVDGSWREAKKMFRKSSYLSHLPVISIELANADEATLQSGYIREAVLDNQLATAQVAAHVLGLYGEVITQQHLAKWFDVFNYHYQKSVCQPNKGNPMSLQHYLTFLDVNYR